MSKFKVGQKIEVESETYCDWCPLPEEQRGCKSALVNCEGVYCDEAQENHDEEKREAGKDLPDPKKVAGEPYYKQFIGKKFAIHCKTQEEWDRVVELFIKEGCTEKARLWGHENFSDAIVCTFKGTGSVDYLKNNGYTIIPPQQFFGELSEEALEPASKGYQHDKEKIDELYGAVSVTRAIREREELERKLWNEHLDMLYRRTTPPLFRSTGHKTNNDSNNNKKSIIKKCMNKIQKCVRDARLSKEEKLLIKFDCINYDKNWLSAGIAAILDMEAQALEYKDFNTICEKLNYSEFCHDEISPFTMHKLIEKHKPELIKTLEAMEKEENKKNK